MEHAIYSQVVGLPLGIRTISPRRTRFTPLCYETSCRSFEDIVHAAERVGMLESARKTTNVITITIEIEVVRGGV